MTDILDVEEAEVGTLVAADGTSKYGKWLDTQVHTNVYAKADYCGAGHLYCLAKNAAWLAAAGGLHKEYAYVQNWYDWMHSHGRISHTAKARRLVWYDWAGTPTGANHIGLIKSVSGGTMKVYEFNHGPKVQVVTRAIDGQVMGFGEWWSFVKQPTPPPPAAADSWFQGVS